MKIKCFTVGLIFFLIDSGLLIAQSCLLYPVSLEQRVTEASVVIEGMVVEKTSYWNNEHSQILTANFIEVYKVFKGENVPETVAVVAQGGQVDMDVLVVHPELNFDEGEYGVFMLAPMSTDFENTNVSSKKTGVNFYKGIAWSQSYISINEGKIHDIFFNYKDNSPSSLYSSLFNYVDSSLFEVRKPTPPGYFENITNEVKAITGFTPATVTAGTLNALGLLTINGAGFGAVRGTGIVRFRNADDGGATFVTVGTDLTTDYISWNDAQVVVRVPNGSGTGTFQLITNGGGSTFTSPTAVNITYNGIDIIFDPGTGAQRYEPDLINDNGAAVGDYTLTFNSSFFSNAPAVASLRDALANWVFKTGVNFVDANTSTSAISTNNTTDGVNIITFNGGLSPGVLGTSFSSYSGCFSGGNVHWSINDLDLLFATVPGGLTWYFGCDGASIGASQFDFQSVATHELGHHHQLGHIINTLGVMHFSISNGQVKRLINTGDDAGGDYVMAHSVINNPCGPLGMTMISGTAPGCAPLPVELISFDAILNNKREVDLTWSTATEINNHYFSVQRSTDLIEFTEVARITGIGNSSSLQNYSTKDTEPLMGTSYYRLNQLDYDGTTTNTSYRVIYNGEVITDLHVVPNPASDFISLQLPDNGYHEIRFFDTSGKMVISKTINEGDLVSIEQLENGLYFIYAIGSNGKIKTKKLIVYR